MDDFFEGLVQTLKDEIIYDKKEQGGRSSPEPIVNWKEQGGRSSPENTVTYRKVFRNAAEMRGQAQDKKKKELTDEQKHGSQGDPGDESLRLNPTVQARQCWFKSAKSCGAIRTCSPTCGHCEGNPN